MEVLGIVAGQGVDLRLDGEELYRLAYLLDHSVGALDGKNGDADIGNHLLSTTSAVLKAAAYALNTLESLPHAIAERAESFEDFRDREDAHLLSIYRPDIAKPPTDIALA